MKILIGLTIIAVAVAIMFAAAWFSEKKLRTFWFNMSKSETEDKLDVIKQLFDERKHSDMLQSELEVTEKAKDNYAAIAEDSRRKLNELREKCKVVGTAFEDWQRVEDIDGTRDYYLEKDGIRLIIDDGVCVGWYKPSDAPKFASLDE